MERRAEDPTIAIADVELVDLGYIWVDADKALLERAIVSYDSLHGLLRRLHLLPGFCGFPAWGAPGHDGGGGGGPCW